MFFCHISDDGFLDENALLLYNNVILKQYIYLKGVP